MSRQNRADDTEWLAESLAAMLDADPSTVAQQRRMLTDERDHTWAGLMGPAAMSFVPADLRVDDIPALMVRLFDVALEEWLESPEAVDGRSADSDDDEPLESGGEEYALSDDCRPVDDRTPDETLWSVLVDNWWRSAPPFVTTNH